MQLDEIIQEHSLTTVSKRTRISVENIERLVNRDFTALQKVRAQGFISIIEREFGVDLSPLRRECKEYYSAFPEGNEEEETLFTVVPPAQETFRMRNNTTYYKVGLAVVLACVGYLAWHVLVASSDSYESNQTVQPESSGFFVGIVDRAKEWFSDSETIEGDDNQTYVSIGGAWAEEKNSSETNTTTDTDTKSDGNESRTEEQIIRDVKKETIIAEEKEDNDSQKPDLQTIIAEAMNETESTETNATTDTKEETLATEVPSMKKEEPAKKPETKKPKTTRTAKVILRPKRKMWIGTVELGKMKRNAKVIEEAITFDTAKGDWALVTGHGLVTFVVNGEERSLNDGQRHFFRIKDGQVREISHEAFQKLNKSKVW